MKSRDAMRQEIVATQGAFHTLLDSLSDASFSVPSDNPAWTVGEVLYHMSIAPKMMVYDVLMFGSKRSVFRLIPFLMPKGVFDWLNRHLTRFGARRLSRPFLRDAYDRATKDILRVFDSLSDEALTRSLPYPDWDPMLSGEITLADLFGYIKRHFESHAGQLQAVLQAPDELPAERNR